MSVSGRQCLNDESFGPAVRGCRANFDFTLLFEQTILTIAPSSIFILLGITRIAFLARRNKVVSGQILRISKQFAIAVYSVVSISILILVCKSAHLPRSYSIAASSLTLATSFLVSVLSWVEHARSLRTSFLLNGYLSFTILFDIAQCRTLFLSGNGSPVGRLFAVALAMKAIILLLEAQSKSKWYHDKSTRSGEVTSGLFSLCTYSWLTSLIAQGHRKILGLKDLPSLDESLSAKHQQPRFEAAWSRSLRHGRPRLLSSLAISAGPRGFYAVLPRVAHIGFALCQPFVIQGISQDLQKPPDSMTVNQGYGWICAAFLAYSGMAVASSLYWYNHQRVVARLRADLVSSIFRQTTALSLSHNEKSKTLTLMSTDVERIQKGMQNIHEIWANAVQVGLATWLLQRQIGTAFLVPLGYVALCVGLSLTLGKFSVQRQGDWMRATQKRVGSISRIIAGMKSLRMMGLSGQLTGTVEEQRSIELRFANRFRLITVLSAIVGFSPLLFSPVLAFASTDRILDTSRLFTSLAFLLLVTNPLAQLLQLLPQLIATLACFDRIADFLQIAPYVDRRAFPLVNSLDDFSSSTESRQSTSKDCAKQAIIESIQDLNTNIDSLEIDTTPSHPLPDSISPTPQGNADSLGTSITMQNLSFGWDADELILRDITLSIPLSKTTLIVGPVGSGKSTLCKALLGEISPSSNAVRFPQAVPSMAFCDQSAWLPNETIRACILGASNIDEEWYSTVLGTTELRHDLEQLADGDATLIGSGGIMLSGGQKLRVALARALYARANTIVLDDIFSGLDKATETQVCENLFGSNGLIKSRRITTVLVSHNARHVHFADHIIALSPKGTVLEAGSLLELQLNSKYVASLAIGDREEESRSPSDAKDAETDNKIAAIAKPDLEDWSRQTGDFAIYRYYFSLFGHQYVVYFSLLCVAVGVLFNFNTIWLKFWSDYNLANPHDVRKGYYLGIYATIQICALGSLGLFIRHNSMSMAVRTGTILHRKALSTVMAASLDFFTRTDVGTTVNRFSQDMTIIDGILALGLSNTAVTSAVACCQAIILALASPYLAICYPFLIAVLYIMQKVYLRTSRQLRFLDLESKAPLYTHFIETTAGLATIRAFGWTNIFINKGDVLLDASQNPAYLLTMIQMWLQSVLHWIITILATVLVALATQLRSSAGFTSVGLISLMTIGEYLGAIIISWTSLETSIGAVSRLKKFSEDVNSEDLLGEDQECSPLWPENGALEIVSLSASYSEISTSDDRIVLKDIALSVKSREKVAIVGRTGSGKSSLILLILRLLNPTLSEKSTMTIDGISLTTLNRRIIRDRLITIPQDSFIIEHLTWQENLQPSKVSTIAECEAVLKDVNLLEAIQNAGGVDAIARPDILSHGQKQLFGLARAVLKGRQKSRIGEKECGGLLLLDEIASSVDENTETMMQDIILREFVGYTIVAVAHRAGSMRGFDTVVVMEDGRIRETGPWAEAVL